MQDFLWKGKFEEKKFHLLAWEEVYSEVNKEGLGIRSLRTMNIVLLIKMVSCIYIDHQSLWNSSLITKYLDIDQVERVFTARDSPMGSMI